jgi:minimal PKS acyl carrier protein
MYSQEMTVDQLMEILREAAGEAEADAVSGDIIDTSFDDLGYDSVALLETVGRIERTYGITLEDATLTQAGTPRALVAVVNERLTVRPAG